MVDLIPKQNVRYPNPATLLFYGGLFVLIGVAGAFLLLSVLNRGIKKDIVSLEQEISRQKTAEELELEATVLRYEQKLQDFGKVAAARVSALPFFEFLEKHVHPGVFFTRFALEGATRTVLLSGESKDFKTLGRQLAIFEDATGVFSVDVSDIGITQKGNVTFHFTLVFNGLFAP